VRYLTEIMQFVAAVPAFIVANWRACAGLAFAVTVAGLALRHSYRKDR
jgi:hypothetical protein